MTPAPARAPHGPVSAGPGYPAAARSFSRGMYRPDSSVPSSSATGPARGTSIAAIYPGTSGNARAGTAGGAGVILGRDTTDRDGLTLSVPAGAWAKFTGSLR